MHSYSAYVFLLLALFSSLRLVGMYLRLVLGRLGALAVLSFDVAVRIHSHNSFRVISFLHLMHISLGFAVVASM